MKISREETIAAVLDASDGHFGRIVREDEPVWKLRDEEPPWFPELRRVIREKQKPSAKNSGRCPGSDAVVFKASYWNFGEPVAECPRCHRHIRMKTSGTGYAISKHVAANR